MEGGTALTVRVTWRCHANSPGFRHACLVMLVFVFCIVCNLFDAPWLLGMPPELILVPHSVLTHFASSSLHLHFAPIFAAFLRRNEFPRLCLRPSTLASTLSPSPKWKEKVERLGIGWNKWDAETDVLLTYAQSTTSPTPQVHPMIVGM